MGRGGRQDVTASAAIGHLSESQREAVAAAEELAGAVWNFRSGVERGAVN